MLHGCSKKLNDTLSKVMWLGAAVGCGAGLALLLLAALGVAGEPPALAAPLATPAPVAVTPARAYNDIPTVITITGSDFAATPTVSLNSAWLEDVGFVDAATLTATVPADLPGGAYTLTVTNPDGYSASLANAFTVDPAGDATLSAWQTVSSTMVIPRCRSAAVLADGYLYAIGGAASGTDFLNSVERASVSPDGSIGAWQVLTSSLGWGRQSFGAIRIGRYIYAIGGPPVVERTTINADGTLSPWEVLTATLNAYTYILGPAVVQARGYIYVIGGFANWYGESSSVERAFVNADGTLSPWEVLTATLNTARYMHTAVPVGGYIYVVGGKACCQGMNSVERAAINADGTLGAWQVLTSTLNSGRALAGTVQKGGYIYELGGTDWGSCPNCADFDTIERAKVYASGALDAWQVLPTRLNSRLAAFAAVQAGDDIYVLGGQNIGTLAATNTVRAATAVYPPYLFSATPSIVPSIHASDVRVHGSNLLHASTLRLADNTLLTITVGTPYTFTATIPAGLAPGWYTATVTLQNGLTATRADLFQVDRLLDLPPFAYLPMISTGCGEFFDDFSSPSSGWYVGDDGRRSAAYLNGEYQVVSKVPGYFWYFYPPTCLRENYIVETYARWAANSGDDYGLIFGLNAKGQYYLFRVSADWGDYNLLRRDPGTWVTLQPWTVHEAVLPGEAWNQLRVTRNGAQIRLDLNGYYLGTWTDGTTTGPTRVGLYSTSYEGDPGYSDARFDEYRITTLPGAISAGIALQSEPGVVGGGQSAAPAMDRDPAPPRERP